MFNVVGLYSSQEQPLFLKKFLCDTFFLLCLYFRAYPTTLLLKILGGRMHGRPPPQIWGDRPPVPLGHRPDYDRNNSGVSLDYSR